MNALDKKIDFIVTFSVENANPNGDPLNGNLPRTDITSHGEMSDVSIKRKIRNRMQDLGEPIFVQANERVDDGNYSLEARYKAHKKEMGKEDKEIFDYFCNTWSDTRAFGQVITFDKKSIGIRGPVSVSLAKSILPISISTMQITRSTNGMESKKGERSSDTMGTKSFVDYGVYKFCGSINPYFAEKTGFTEEDAECIKESLIDLFANDASSARPEGSMEVQEVFWFTHPNKLGVASSGKIHRLLETDPNMDLTEEISDYEQFQVHLNAEKLKEYEEKGMRVEILSGR